MGSEFSISDPSQAATALPGSDLSAVREDSGATAGYYCRSVRSAVGQLESMFGISALRSLSSWQQLWEAQGILDKIMGTVTQVCSVTQVTLKQVRPGCWGAGNSNARDCRLALAAREWPSAALRTFHDDERLALMGAGAAPYSITGQSSLGRGLGKPLSLRYRRRRGRHAAFFNCALHGTDARLIDWLQVWLVMGCLSDLTRSLTTAPTWKDITSQHRDGGMSLKHSTQDLLSLRVMVPQTFTSIRYVKSEMVCGVRMRLIGVANLRKHDFAVRNQPVRTIAAKATIDYAPLESRQYPLELAGLLTRMPIHSGSVSDNDAAPVAIAVRQMGNVHAAKISHCEKTAIHIMGLVFAGSRIDRALSPGSVIDVVSARNLATEYYEALLPRRMPGVYPPSWIVSESFSTQAGIARRTSIVDILFSQLLAHSIIDAKARRVAIKSTGLRGCMPTQLFRTAKKPGDESGEQHLICVSQDRLGLSLVIDTMTLSAYRFPMGSILAGLSDSPMWKGKRSKGSRRLTVSSLRDCLRLLRHLRRVIDLNVPDPDTAKRNILHWLVMDAAAGTLGQALHRYQLVHKGEAFVMTALPYWSPTTTQGHREAMIQDFGYVLEIKLDAQAVTAALLANHKVIDVLALSLGMDYPPPLLDFSNDEHRRRLQYVQATGDEARDVWQAPDHSNTPTDFFAVRKMHDRTKALITGTSNISQCEVHNDSETPNSRSNTYAHN